MRTIFPVIALTVSATSALASSTFQQTCSNIEFAFSGSTPTITAMCLTEAGLPNATSLTIAGISNQNGILTRTGGASTFQKSCGSIAVETDQIGASLIAICRKSNGEFSESSIDLPGISNNNGVLSD